MNRNEQASRQRRGVENGASSPTCRGGGLTPKGLPMAQTLEEWKYLAELYARGLEIEKREKSLLRVELNKLKQKLAKIERRGLNE